MRFLVSAVVLALVASNAVAAEAQAGERYKIRNAKRELTGDVYCPGHGRRCQIRDTRRNIVGYVERDGTITDRRRRKVLKLEDLEDSK